MRPLSRRLFLLALLLTAPALARAQRLSALAPRPEWAELDAFQETITREEFERLLDQVYAPRGAAAGLIEIQPTQAIVRTQLEPATTWVLHFAPDTAAAKTPPRQWRTASELGARDEARPLGGWRIALDPGHIGGEWAQIEERWFRIGDSLPVTEGDMTLRVANLLAPQLRALGAEVTFVRDKTEPVTPARPETLRDVARAELALQGVAEPRENYENRDDPNRGTTVQGESELLFYRTSEIRRRAEIVNRELKPDLTVCLHFNAEAWGDPKQPSFVPRNHLHVLVNGCYSAAELRNDDVRFDMLVKLLSRSFDEELGASESVAASLARATSLPPYEYPFGNAIRVGESPFVWARNLLANRLYRTPVVFLEPYVMNSQEVWERVQAGDYEGERLVAGAMRKSIFREYADAVAEGLVNYVRSKVK